MPRYRYEALGAGGEVRSGEVSAATREAAISRLRQRRIVPLNVTETRGQASLKALFRRRTVNEKDLVLFTREFAILLGAGMPLDRTLSRLDAIISEGPMSGVAGDLLRRVKGGSALADALIARPEVFPPFYAGMVRAGEAGGALVPVLERLAEMLAKAEALKASIRSALTYPTLVLLITGLSLAVLLVFVVPEFRPMFDRAGAELPPSARIVLGISDFVQDWGMLFGAALLAALLLIRQQSLSDEGRVRLDRAALGAPLFGELVRKIETARFCRSLGTLRANGVTLVEAVGIAAGTLANRAVAEAARGITGALSRGEGLATPMRRTGCFPDLALQLIEVGEESGRLEDMLLQVADVYDTEVERTVQRLLALLAPTVTIVLGCLIALIIGAIMSAILGSYDLAL